MLKGLPGLLTLLADAGYSEEESLRWLFAEDPLLPGTPVQALADNRGTEVKRRAQALGF
ncbi:MAG TPA: Rv2175c family DNA-binding protein [Frankiaceae bacterium]|nr:Rv2175c family DNA-binding protein [Frankiaceae bacterium]